MIRSRPHGLLAALACALALGAAQAAPQVDVLPPEVVSTDGQIEWDRGTLERFKSEPLWQANALQQYAGRYRFSYNGMLIYSLQVQIDQARDGKAVLIATVLRFRRVIERQRRRLSDGEFAEFQQLVDKSGIWTIYPEYWQFKDAGDICLDGMNAILEKRTEAGYRFSQANTSCTSPAGMNRLIEKMAALARLETKVAWFPWSKHDFDR